MTLWLCHQSPTSTVRRGRVQPGGLTRVDCERRPAPTIMASGIFNDRLNRYWLEDDGLPSGVIPSDRPPYRVPTMAEVRATPPNGLTVVSTFTGAGGSCLGFRMAGFRCVWASEFVPAARDTYRANFPDVTMDERDIRQVEAADVLAATGLARGELDVLEGSPPCASFSTAGRREKGWNKVKKYSDTEQRTDDLFFEYARLLDGLQPRAFVAENVSGLAKGTAKGYFMEIMARLRACGYVVRTKLLDAQWLGVPQARQRLIFVGTREDLGLAPAFPKPLPYRYSIRDACPWISRVVHDTGGQPSFSSGEITDRPSVTVVTHATHHFKVDAVDAPPVEPEASMDGTAVGAEYDRLRPGEQSDRYFSLVRPREDAPCPTVTQLAGTRGVAGVAHPIERRKFSMAELRRICSFPDDFALTGSYSQQWERLGRAVPPLMMFRVASVLREVLTCERS